MHIHFKILERWAGSGSGGSGGVQWLNNLVQKYDDLSSNPQNTHKAGCVSDPL